MEQNQAKNLASNLNSHVVFERSIEAAEGDALLKTAYDSLNSLVCRGSSYGIFTDEQRDALSEAFNTIKKLEGYQDNWQEALKERFRETQGS